METLYIKIYRATDTFLYLPVYIADDLDILKTILGGTQDIGGKKYDINIELVSPKQNRNKGDEGAILEMLQNTNDNTVAIAICSPVSFLNSKIINTEETNNVRVVGAIINKLAFWALATNNHRDEIQKISDFGNHFKNVIYPNNEYITAHYLGEKIKKEANIVGVSDNVDFGAEIEKLRDHNNAVAVTANIAALAEALGTTVPSHINYSFSEKEGEFLTTGIVTSKKSCEQFPNIIEKIIDSIQMSIAILYSSEKTARKNCAEIAKKSEFSEKFSKDVDETSDSIKKIIELVYKEEFYPKHDLRITKESWGEAVAAFAKIGAGESKVLFEKYVDNSFVLKSTTKRLSIDLDAPRNTTPCKKHTNGGCSKTDALEKQIKELQEKEKYFIKWLWKFSNFLTKNKYWLLPTIIAIIVSIGVLIANHYCKFITELEVAIITAVATILGIAFGIINQHLKNKKNTNEKQSN